MSNAAAEYVIKAKDETKSAVASIKRGFDGIDSGARKLSKGIKALGIGAAAFKAWQIATHGAEAAIANLAKTNADFARSIEKAKTGYQNLWVAGDQAAAAQERLNAALSNPEILGTTRRMADSLSAGYIDLKRNILEALSEAQKFDRWMGERLGVYDKSDGLKRDFEGLVASKMPGAIEAQRAADAARGPNKYMDMVRAANARDAKQFADDAKKAAEAAKKSNEDFLSGVRDTMGDTYDEIARGYDTEAQRHLTYFIEPVIGNFKKLPEAAKEAGDQMTVYADQAARNMQDAFADLLFDPLDNGFKGLLRSAIDVARRIVAEFASAKLFGSKSSGGLGLGDWISGALGSLFGGGARGAASAAAGGTFSGPRAAGGPVDAGRSYLVGERGRELFTPRVAGHITPNHALGGGVVQNITVDARGATVDAIRAIPAAMAEAKRQAVAEVQELVRRGRL